MRNSPKGIKLLRDERVLQVTWEDGEQNRYPTRTLRCDCRCASCVDENTGIRILDVNAVPSDVTITDMKLIGAYSIRFDFSDGHATGLFTWDHLADLASAESDSKPAN